MKKGVPVSPGVAIARAYCMDQALDRHQPKRLNAAAVSVEAARFDSACAKAREELDDIIAQVSRQVGDKEAAIFRTHRLLLDDQALLTKVESFILDHHVDAPTALQEVLNAYVGLFSQIPDEYLKERLADIRDVIGRIRAQLAVQESPPSLGLREPAVVVASEILPSQVIAFEQLQVAGIVTETGGATGHAAILARSLDIPAVTGIRGALKEIRTGDLLVLDGREGTIFLNPGPEVVAAFHKLRREYVRLRDRLVANRELESVTEDGVRVELLANVNSPADAKLAARVGAAGVGLYRTEYLFLTHPSVPSEEEQLASYRAVIDAAPNRMVTIRTLDIGGDKQVPYLGIPHQANPFLGWRSTRLSFGYPELFQTQLRAILRAGIHGQVKLLLPMISTLQEIRQLKRVLSQVRVALARQAVAFAEDIPLGVMIEVPAAALCIEDLLDEVDFVSIGSNDLIQYVMAADRDNPKVAHLCEPFHPAVLRVLRLIVEACNNRGKVVTLCGEMAGRPRCLVPLLGLGLRRLSMSPALVPTIKELVRRASERLVSEIAKDVLRMRTSEEILAYLTQRTRELWPEVTMLDTRESTDSPSKD
jgi:phosphoenolpyruvate-protein phosphotransferase